MQTVLKNFIIENNLQCKTILAGYSAGTDSTCLLHALNKQREELSLKVIAIHLNHGWRGDASDEDEVFAKNFCENSGIEFYSEKLPGNSMKTETAAREARYDFFERCLQKFNADAIFLAHNKNDNVETLVYRLIKGTGIEGLKSIPQKRDKIFRPLLRVSRAEIETYVNKNSLSFREDVTNIDIKYTRNYIRHTILPSFEKINPNYLNNIENLIEVANYECEILEDALFQARNEVFEGEKMDTQKFLAQSYPIKLKLIYNYLKDDLKFYDFIRIKRIVDFIIEHSTQAQDPQFRPYKKFSINSKLFLHVNKKEIFKGE